MGAGFEEPLCSVRPTRPSGSSLSHQGAGLGKGVSLTGRRLGDPWTTLLCAMTESRLRTITDPPGVESRWSKPIILLRSRSKSCGAPRGYPDKPINHRPHPPPESLPAPDPICTFLRGNRSFKPAWSGRRACKPRAPGGCTGVSRRQLPADLHAGLAAERPPRPSHRRQWPRGRGPVLACSRIHTLPAEGGSRSSSLRRFCPPPHTHAAYAPSLSSLPWDRESYRLKTFISW